MKNIKFIIIFAVGVIVIVSVLYFVFNNKNASKNSNVPKIASNTNGNTATSNNSPFNLSELTSITNYTFSSVNNSVAFDGSVYSSSNWSLTSPFQEEHINGYIYTDLGGKWYRQSEGTNNYESSSYIGAAKEFLGMFKVAGSKLITNGNCNYAGENGTIYEVEVPQYKQVKALASACLADKNKAMLEYNIGAAIKTSYASASLSYVFTIKSIDNVLALSAPSSYTND